MSFSNPIVGGETLIRRAIKSPDYAPGIDGWTINRDGTVEFNAATIRGDLIAGGGNVLVNSNGLRVNQPGGDSLFVHVTEGFLIAAVSGGFIQVEIDQLTGRPRFVLRPQTSMLGIDWIDSVIQAYYSNPSPGVEAPLTEFHSPSVAGGDRSTITMFGERSDGTGPYVDLSTGLVVNGSSTINGALIVTNNVLAPAHGGKVFKDGIQAIPNATTTEIDYNAIFDFYNSDGNALHDPGGANPERFRPVVKGWYRVTLHTNWAGNTVGARRTYLGKNGATIGPAKYVPNPQTVSGQFNQELTTKVYMNGTTDYFSHFVRQESGGVLNISGQNLEAQTFNTSIEWELISYE